MSKEGKCCILGGRCWPARQEICPDCIVYSGSSQKRLPLTSDNHNRMSGIERLGLHTSLVCEAMRGFTQDWWSSNDGLVFLDGKVVIDKVPPGDAWKLAVPYKFFPLHLAAYFGIVPLALRIERKGSLLTRWKLETVTVLRL